VCGLKFDVFLARSVWTHAPKSQIQAMLDGFVQALRPDSFFLTSYYPARWFGAAHEITKKQIGAADAIFRKNPIRSAID